jgi:hypothetical protein
MNKHHPLDEVFRTNLQDRAAEPPLHLWEQIDQKRTLRYRFLNQARQKKPLAALLASMAMAGIALLLWNARQPQLRSFPVLAPAGNTVATVAAVPSSTTTSVIIQQSAASTTQQSVAAVSTVPSAVLSGDVKKQATTADATGTVPPSSLNSRIVASAMPAAVNAAALAQTAAAEGLVLAEAKQAVQEVPTQPAVRPKLIPDLPALEPVAQDALENISLAGLFGSNEPKCARFGDGNWAVYLDVMASPDLTFNNLQARQADAQEYLEKRKETESRLFAFSGGVRLSMIADNGLALRTGVNYSQINEKFSYYNGRVEETSIREIFDSDNNVIGFDTVTVVGERFKVSNNIYRTIDIPFIVGYEFDAGKLGVAVNGGVYLNLLFMPDGDLLDPETLEPRAIERGGFDAFKEQVGIGYYSSVGLTYRMKNGLQLLLEPHFKVFPKSVTQDEYALTQRYMSAGLFMGVRKRL